MVSGKSPLPQAAPFFACGAAGENGAICKRKAEWRTGTEPVGAGRRDAAFGQREKRIARLSVL